MDMDLKVRLEAERRNKETDEWSRIERQKQVWHINGRSTEGVFWGLSIEAISTDWLCQCVTRSWSLETVCVCVCVLVRMCVAGLRASAVVRAEGHAPLLEALQKSHIVKPQSPQRERLHLVEMFLLLHPVLNFWLHLFGCRREREHGDGFLMILERKAHVVCMVRGLTLQCYAWIWLLRGFHPIFYPSEV